MPDVTGQLLLTEALLNAYDPATVDIDPLVVASAIGGVSERMLRHIGNRLINPQVVVTEYQRLRSGDRDVDYSKVFCSEYPVSALTLTHAGTVLVEGTDFILSADSGMLTRTSSAGDPINWLAGTLKLEYTAGYAAVPADLEQLAAVQCVSDLMKQSKHFLGIKQKDPDTGTTVTLEEDGLLPSVVQGLVPWQRKAYADGSYG